MPGLALQACQALQRPDTKERFVHSLLSSVMEEGAQLPRPSTPGPAVLERTAMDEGVQIPSLAGTMEDRQGQVDADLPSLWPIVEEWA